ncbi:MAG: hypothetical protein P4N41_07515 [Negativicutes bacterium]|nr:hypothetical protein [Negativicutes bacterium]
MWQDRWSRREFLRRMTAAGVFCLLPAAWPRIIGEGAGTELMLSTKARCVFGEWGADIRLSSGRWQPGNLVRLTAELTLSQPVFAGLTQSAPTAEELLLLITAERCFDSAGTLRFPAADGMSTLLTPTGLPIEGGTSGAVSRWAGSRHRNVVDELLRLPVTALEKDGDWQRGRFDSEWKLPDDLPGGIYRLRLDFGFADAKRRWSFNREGFGQRQKEAENMSLLYSPPLVCDGVDGAGGKVDASGLKPRLWWVLLGQYNSNGYRGVVAAEDSGRFALSSRNIIQDEVILPLYDSRGNRIGYNLEPVFPPDLIDRQRNIPWDFSSGELSVQVTDPAGRTADLGTAPFIGAKNGLWPTTGNPLFTNWKPGGYGRYKVVARGWLADAWGNRYHGGGTYSFWIANRLTMGTATFQGVSYPVGSRYGRDIGFAPAMPADVTVQVDLYPSSDSGKRRSLAYSGKATDGGAFGAAQGLKPFLLDAPGEYHAHILATYTDREGHLWVSSMRHAGVVYPEDTPLIARGKKLRLEGRFADRGETRREGFIEQGDGFKHLEHINFPYQAGDVLLIASEGQGANKIEPVLTYETKGAGTVYEQGLNAIGATNLRIATSGGLSPHLYPEYITDMAYYYAAAPRPGFSGRFLVGEDGVRGPYWPTSSHNFGGQIGASPNGDSPGDIYRLIGGVVLRPKNQEPRYAGYQASAFILPKGSANNRVIAPGGEEITGADGNKARFFMVPVRPGMVYQQGAMFVPVLQIDPVLPANIRFELRYPGGMLKVAEGSGDPFGYFVGKERWQLEEPGLYVFNIKADWQGYPGSVPGLPPQGGYVFVQEKQRPTGAAGLVLNLRREQAFTAQEGLLITGQTTASQVFYTAVTPGAVVDQGVIPVNGGQFAYRVDPQVIHQRIPIYDIENHRSGKPQLGRVIHLTFFSRETVDKIVYHSFARVILRGGTAVYAQ